MMTATRVLRPWVIFGCVLGGLWGGRIRAEDWDRPIPQDPKAQAQRYSDRRAWERKTLLEAYDKFGKKDPRWDRDARSALEVAVQAYSRDKSPLSTWRELKDGCRRAMSAGCDDPLILQLEGWASTKFEEPDSDQVIHRSLKAANALEQSPYPAIRKVWALDNAVKNASIFLRVTPEEKQDIPRHVDLIMKWLPLSASEGDVATWTEGHWREALRAVLDARRASTKDVEGTLSWIDEQVQRMPEGLKVAWLQAQTDFLQDYAWEARGNGTADTVTEDGWEKMNDRTARAKALIERAWALKPGVYYTALLRLRLSIAVDRDRDEMERWFRRAMEANGNGLQACRAKAYWLEPKWFGSEEDLIAFGRLCGDTKNWEAGITLLEPECGLIATSAWDRPPGGDFWKSPEVWKRCRAIFEEYLSHNPEDNAQRSRYAIIASLTGHHGEATEQYEKLGENFYYNKNWGMTKEWFRSLRDDSAKRPKGVKPYPR